MIRNLVGAGGEGDGALAGELRKLNEEYAEVEGQLREIETELEAHEQAPRLEASKVSSRCTRCYSIAVLPPTRLDVPDCVGGDKETRECFGVGVLLGVGVVLAEDMCFISVAAAGVPPHLLAGFEIA